MRALPLGREPELGGQAAPEGRVSWEDWSPKYRSDEQMDLLIEITRLEHVIATAQGAQLRAMAGFVHAVERDVPADAPNPCSHADAKRAAVDSAYVIADETIHVDDDLAAKVEATALGKAPGLTPGKLRTWVSDLLLRLDPAVASRRRQAAKAERKVTLSSRPDGMAAFGAILTEEQAVAIYNVIDTYARAATGSEDPRGIDAVRADTLVDLVLHPHDLVEPRVEYQMQVVVPAGTLLGLGDEPGHLPGHGPLDADTCRALAQDATWSRLLAEPTTGHLLDLGATKYKPSNPLARFVQTRDRTCRWPGCRRRAVRCDLDHCVPPPDGGPTSRCNICALCRHHHVVKHLPGWHAALDPDDAALTITTPHGLVYRTRPPAPTGPEPPVEMIRVPDSPPTAPVAAVSLIELIRSWSATSAAASSSAAPF